MKYEIDVVEKDGKKAFTCAALGSPVFFPEIQGYSEFETGTVEIFRDEKSISKSKHIMPYGTMGTTTRFYIDLQAVFDGASCQPPETLYAKDFTLGDHITIDTPLISETYDHKSRFFETYLKRYQSLDA